MKSNRLMQIKQLLLKEGKLTNTDLCRRFGISMATARRDLDILEAEGIIRRIYGGAVPAETDPEEENIPGWERRRQEGLSEKERIAIYAARKIPDNCTVYLDSGTTLYEVAKCLVGRSNLTVITNSLRIAALLGMEKGLQVYCIGGHVKVDMLVTLGMLANESISLFPHIDVAVFSADGFQPHKGLMEYSMEVALLKKSILAKTGELMAVLDSSKIGKVANVNTCSTTEIHTLITDDAAPKNVLDQVRERGIRVIIAE